jgi:hypothetical protein
MFRSDEPAAADSVFDVQAAIGGKSFAATEETV